MGIINHIGLGFTGGLSSLYVVVFFFRGFCWSSVFYLTKTKMTKFHFDLDAVDGYSPQFSFIFFIHFILLTSHGTPRRVWGTEDTILAVTD